VKRTVALLALIVVLAAGCDGSRQPQAVTLLYIDMTRSTASAKASALRDVDVVLDEVVSERGRLVIDVIDNSPLAHARVVTDLSFRVPEAGGNRLVERRKLDERRAGVTLAVRSLLDDPRPADSTDVFGALAAAGQRLQAFEGPAWRRRLVLLSDMVATTPPRSLTASRWDERSIAKLVEELRAARMLPRLSGTEIWVSGAGLSAGPGLSAARIMEIRAVWLAVFAATGAKVAFYGPQLVRPGSQGA
jgi:hypothetical protein